MKSKFLLDAVDIFSRFIKVQTLKNKYAGHFASFRKKIFSEKTLLKNFGMIKEQYMGKTSKKISQEKILKFTRQDVKQKLHLQREQFNH